MRTLILTTIVLATILFASTAQAGVFGRRNNRGPAVQPVPVVAAPATVTTARAENGYRSFSYQPAPVYDSPNYGLTTRQSVGNGFHDAGWKIRGF